MQQIPATRARPRAKGKDQVVDGPWPGPSTMRSAPPPEDCNRAGTRSRTGPDDPSLTELQVRLAGIVERGRAIRWLGSGVRFVIGLIPVVGMVQVLDERWYEALAGVSIVAIASPSVVIISLVVRWARYVQAGAATRSRPRVQPSRPRPDRGAAGRAPPGRRGSRRHPSTS